MDDLMHQFEQALLAFDRITAKEIILEAEKSEGASQCIEQIIVPALINIGDSWEKEDVALSQVYMSGRICEELVDAILPPEASSVDSQQPPMAIALLDDYHSLGKRIIYSALRANGFNLADWGRLDAEEMVAKTIENNIQILLISVLMLPSALAIKPVVEELKQKNPDIQIVVGGAPFRFDDQLWKEVGAHATGKDTSQAIEVVSRIVEMGP